MSNKSIKAPHYWFLYGASKWFVNIILWISIQPLDPGMGEWGNINFWGWAPGNNFNWRLGEIELFTFLPCCVWQRTRPYWDTGFWHRQTLSDSIVHYSDVIMSTMASQIITSLTIVYSNVYSGADQRKHRSSASLAFVRGIHQWPMNSPHKGTVTRKMFPCDDVIMLWLDRHTLFNCNALGP